MSDKFLLYNGSGEYIGPFETHQEASIALSRIIGTIPVIQMMTSVENAEKEGRLLPKRTPADEVERLLGELPTTLKGLAEFFEQQGFTPSTLPDSCPVAQHLKAEVPEVKGVFPLSGVEVKNERGFIDVVGLPEHVQEFIAVHDLVVRMTQRAADRKVREEKATAAQKLYEQKLYTPPSLKVGFDPSTV